MTNLTFLQSIQKKIRSPYFSDEDLKIANDDLETTAIHNALSYSLKTKKILKIKRGLYCLNIETGKKNFSNFQLSNYLVVVTKRLRSFRFLITVTPIDRGVGLLPLCIKV